MVLQTVGTLARTHAGRQARTHARTHTRPHTHPSIRRAPAAGSYDIAALAAGGVIKAVEAVVFPELDAAHNINKTDGSRRFRNAYCLVRPPGHHAVAGQGMGCVRT